MTSFTAVFDQFVESYINESNPSNQGLLTYYDEEWLSPCLINETSQANDSTFVPLDNDLVAWRPFSRGLKHDLSNIESALEINIPAELSYLFCGYYSHDFNALAPDGPLTILQAWNEHDFERLQKNLIAHVLMKRRLKQPDTLFFALTDQDDIILSIDVATQAVVVERVGKEAHKKVADNLSDFIQHLSPVPALVEL